MKPTSRSPAAGFTRADLAATIAAVAVLALTVAGVDRNGANTVACRSNLRQLTSAWSLYALDNTDVLPANDGKSGSKNWCAPAFLDFTATAQNYSPTALTNGSLWRYAANPDSWHCPGDPSTVRAPVLGDVRRNRSYSMNGYIGTVSPWSPGYRVYLKTTDLTVPGPAKTFVVLDEHPASINDGFFAVDMSGFNGSPSALKMIDFPGSHHSGAGNLSFGDGHVETWKWRDPRTKPPYHAGVQIPLNIAAAGNPDVTRIQSATTARP